MWNPVRAFIDLFFRKKESPKRRKRLPKKKGKKTPNVAVDERKDGEEYTRRFENIKRKGEPKKTLRLENPPEDPEPSKKKSSKKKGTRGRRKRKDENPLRGLIDAPPKKSVKVLPSKKKKKVERKKRPET
jgi:hypothetical protein